MIGLLILVAFIGLYGIALAWALVRSVGARFPLGIVLAGALVVLRVLAVVSPPLSLWLGIASLAACAVVLVIAWRRRATLPPSAPALTQMDKVVSPFLLLAILNAAGITV